MSSKRNITYKCPYCDKRFNKENLVIHVSDKHDEMIPENYSAFRLVFDYVNKKPAGYNGKCIICGNESGWDEEKGKYNRLCSNPACKKKYIQSFEERMIRSKGVKRISSTAEGQAKMLANRKISGEYKFQDGGIKTFTGTYEKKALEFMDKVMNIKSEDVSTPGPIMEYDFDGKKHIYISDIYYVPYNLIIEVKDGGNNPNNRSMPEYRAKQIAKEKYIIKETDFNYLRLTNNDFSQLLAVFMELKMEMSNDTPDRIIRINEGIISNRLQYPYKYGEAKKINKELADKINSTDYPWYFINITELINSGVDINLYGFNEEPIEGVNNYKYKKYHLYNKKVKTFHGRDSLNPSLRKYSKFNKGASKTKDVVLKEEYIEEKYIGSQPDILYNKEAFDSGEINLCFVTGFSGSGKSTLAHSKESNETEAYELDDILWNHRFSDDNLKEYGDLIYSYFKGPGKKYRVHNKDEFKKLFRSAKENDETSNVNGCTKEFIDHVKEFVKYSINYSKSHKNKKYIIEGIYLYMFFEPSYFKDYAFYIKGTSLLKSTKRALKRDWENNKSNGDKLSKRIDKANNKIYHTMKNINYDNRLIDKFIKYFKDKPETILGESYIEERSIRGDVMLYHGSVDGTYKTIENNSINNGKRFENSRTSSFWFIKKKYAEMFATAELVQTLPNRNKDELFILIDNDMKTLVDEKYKSRVIDWISKNDCYVYTKLMNGKYITGGQGRNFPEYTLEFPVKPDNVSKVSFESKINSIKFVSRSYIDSIIEKYKKNKMNYGNSLFGQMIDNILYNSHQDIIQNKKDIKRFNEDYIEEGFLKSEPDILYNKEAFDNGDINICFITGLSGSGKSTMGSEYKDNGVDVVNMDLLQNPADDWHSISDIKKYSELMYQFYNGPGKKYFVTWNYLVDNNIPGTEYEDKLFPEFIEFAKKYAKLHKDKKIICEGVYFLCMKSDGSKEPLFKPEQFKDYAFYIKGTSVVKSRWRAILRDSKFDYDSTDLYSDNEDVDYKGFRRFINILKLSFKDNWKYYFINEKYINKFRNYFKNKPETVLSESMSWKESDDKIKSIKKIYYGLTESESKKKSLVYKGKNKGVNATLEGLIKFLKDNDMQNTITKYVILDIDQFDIDYNIKYDEKYDMFCIKTPFEFEIKNPKDINYSISESYIEETSIAHPKKLYFVSKDNMDNSILQPRIPSNYMTKNNYEENKTPRICFAPSIDKCLIALGENLSNKKLYVHIVDDISKYEILKPDTSEVPDSGITNEYWICSPVKIKCIGQIICKDTGVTDDGIPYTYGDGKSASLYKWDWEWIKQFNESKDASVIEDDFKKKSGKSFKLIDLNTKEALKYVSNKWRNDKECRLAICKEDDKLAGYIYWNKSGTIAPLEVYKDYRGYGLSETLMKEAIKNGGNKLGVYSDNEVAIRLYKKLGFVETGRKKYKDGDEVIIMELKSSLNEAYTKELGKIQRDPEIIDSYGFISSDGIYNENVKIKGFDKWLRGRSELLIIDKGKVYLKKDPKKGYSIPGGGWEKDEDHNLSAIRETNEEARIKVKNVNYVSSYVAYFPPKDWVKEKISEENWWYGEYIELYIGEYDGQYKGKVDKIDQDKAMESGKFYDIKSIYNDLIPVHQEALSDIINEASISDYKFLDIKSNKSKALEYLKTNSETKSYAEDTIKNYNGELVIYNDIMIGRILIGDKKDKGFITDFFIDEEHRGNKLGSKLIDDAINKYHGVDLLVDKDNKLALDMYKRRGFVVIKTVKNQYWMKLESKLKEDTNMMNEAMNALLTGYIPGSVDNPNNTYIVNYMQNNVFSDEDPNEDCIGVSSDPLFTNMIIRDKNGMLKRVDESFLKDKQYKVYILEKSRDEVNRLITANIGNFVKYGYLYETLTGKKLYTKDQIQFESLFIPTLDYYESMDTFKEICDNYFFARDKKEESINESTFIPKEVRYFNNSGLMYIDKVYTLDGYINSKSNKVLEALDISIN